ncbi:MAG: prefoldin subunit alpha [Nanoarchaeota archaeon]
MSEKKTERVKEDRPLLKEDEFTQEKLKEMYIQFQQLQKQIEKISGHMEALGEKNNELNVAIASLVQLAETALNAEILAPVADGIFLHGELKDNEKLIVNMGAGVAVERTIPEAIRLLEEQRTTILSNFKQAEKVLQELQKQALQIYEAVNGRENSKETAEGEE